MKIFDAVVDGTTAALNLQNIDFSSSPGDLARAKERESSTRRKMQQCLYLRGISTVFRAFISPQIASVGYHPRSIMDAGTGVGATKNVTTQFFIHEKLPKGDLKATKASVARAKGRRPIAPGSSPKKRLQRDNATKEEIAEIAEAALAIGDPQSNLVTSHHPHQQQQTQLVPFQFDVDLPSMWQTYLRAFFRQQADSEQLMSLKLTKAHVKTLILDICLEFLKADHLQLENSCLWTIAPFVCDYFIARYEASALVGCWLFSFVEGLLAFQDDRRVAFFCGASGLATSGSTSSPGYDVFLYYLHALGHIFFGQMKIFKAENRLEETAEGSCPVHVKHILATANTLFGFTFTGSEKKALILEIDTLPPVVRAQDATAEAGKLDDTDEGKLVELDDAMTVFLSKWSAMSQQVDEVRGLLFVSAVVLYLGRVMTSSNIGGPRRNTGRRLRLSTRAATASASISSSRSSRASPTAASRHVNVDSCSATSDRSSWTSTRCCVWRALTSCACLMRTCPRCHSRSRTSKSCGCRWDGPTSRRSRGCVCVYLLSLLNGLRWY